MHEFNLKTEKNTPKIGKYEKKRKDHNNDRTTLKMGMAVRFNLKSIIMFIKIQQFSNIWKNVFFVCICWHVYCAFQFKHRRSLLLQFSQTQNRADHNFNNNTQLKSA